MKRTFSVAILSLLACGLLHAQAPIQVDPKTASQHLLEHPQANIPPIAYAAHLYGTVVIAVTIDQAGRISWAHVVSGPAMLQQVALDAVERYTYTPFQADGKPVSVDSQISVDFGANSQPHEAKGLGNFLQALKWCEQQTSKPGKSADQVKACGHASQLADALPEDAPFRDRVTAYVQYVTALIRDGKAADAVPVGNKAIAMSKILPESVSGLCASYEVTGEASAVAGNLQAADQYLTQAEDCQSRTLQLSTSPLLKQHDSQVMQGLLQFHAKVLTAMGNHTVAAEKLNQAAKL